MSDSQNNVVLMESPLNSGMDGLVKCEDGVNPLRVLADHFASQGCEDFAVEGNTLHLRWPDGRRQKVILDPNEVSFQ